MAKRRLVAGLLGLVLLASLAPASAQADREAQLRQDLQAATWPADIVRLADAYVARFPTTDFAGTAATLRQRAGDAMRALSQNEVRLFRSAFVSNENPAGHEDMRLAALADANAAVRLAHQNRRVAGHDAPRYLGWLQYASALGDERASYELALHYRVSGQPVLAARYETLAVEGGYVPPTWLDNTRK